MKSTKLTKLGVTALSAIALCGCANKNDAPIMTDVPTDTPVETLAPEELTIVNGIVEEAGEDYILLLTDGADGQEIVINHASLDATDTEMATFLKEGDRLRAAYSGVMTMSIPAQIGGAVDIEMIDEEGNVITLELEAPEAEVEVNPGIVDESAENEATDAEAPAETEEATAQTTEETK